MTRHAGHDFVYDKGGAECTRCRGYFHGVGVYLSHPAADEMCPGQGLQPCRNAQSFFGQCSLWAHFAPTAFPWVRCLARRRHAEAAP